MDFIVVYDKTTKDNSIVAIHSQRFTKDVVNLRDIHPEDDPERRGVVVVPGEIVSRMVLRKYKHTRSGSILEKPVLVERSKDLVSIADSALGQNVLFFAEPIAELISVRDLSGKVISATLLNADKGIVGTGASTGVFLVVCKVATGIAEPEIVAETKNWRWKYDTDDNIVGMELIGSEG